MKLIRYESLVFHMQINLFNIYTRRIKICWMLLLCSMHIFLFYLLFLNARVILLIDFLNHCIYHDSYFFPPLFISSFSLYNYFNYITHYLAYFFLTKVEDKGSRSKDSGYREESSNTIVNSCTSAATRVSTTGRLL